MATRLEFSKNLAMRLDLDKKTLAMRLEFNKNLAMRLDLDKNLSKYLEYGKNLAMRLDSVLATRLDYKQRLG